MNWFDLLGGVGWLLLVAAIVDLAAFIVAMRER